MITLLASLSLAGVMLCACSSGFGSVRDDFHERQQDSDLRDNMRIVQVAAEHYAAAHGGGSYPTEIDDEFKTYFRGGVEGQTPAPVGLVNPFTATNDFPSKVTIRDPLSVRHSRRFNFPRGAIGYSVLGDGKGYAIVGGAHDGKALSDCYNPSDVLVLTNMTNSR